jgi:hypothetical protein
MVQRRCSICLGYIPFKNGRMNDNDGVLERKRKWPIWMYYPSIFMERLSKITYFRQGSHSIGRYSNKARDARCLWACHKFTFIRLAVSARGSVRNVFLARCHRLTASSCRLADVFRLYQGATWVSFALTLTQTCLSRHRQIGLIQ